MPIDLRQPCILIELNGADPLHTASVHGTVRTIVLDWDEVRAGEYPTDELVSIHDDIEVAAPYTARSIRDYLREQGVELPAAYDAEVIG